MTQWVDALKEQSIPDYAKDIKLNLDAVIKRSSLPVEEAEAVALAAAFATGNSKLWTWMHSVDCWCHHGHEQCLVSLR